MSKRGNVRQPDTWLTLSRASIDRCAHVGIRLDWASDAITITLQNGETYHIYGNGQVWRESTASFIFLQDEDNNWR